MYPDADRYMERVVNDGGIGSSPLRAIDGLRPPDPVADQQRAQLADDHSDLVGTDDNDFIGSRAGKIGIDAPDQARNLTLLLVPERATAAVHGAKVSYCEVDRGGGLFAIFEQPVNQSATEIVSYVLNVAALGEPTELAAIYWPRVLVLDQFRGVLRSADKILVTPSGIVAGMLSWTHSARPDGIYPLRPASVRAGCSAFWASRSTRSSRRPSARPTLPEAH